MWFLQIDKLLIIALFSLTVGLIQTHTKIRMKFLIPVIQTVILFVFHIGTAVFYLIYLTCGLFFCAVLYKVKTGKRLFFLLFCVFAVAPLFLARSTFLINGISFDIVTIGIAFNMLKLIDALYHVYYAEEKISALTYVNYMLFLPVFTAGPVFRYRNFRAAYEDLKPLDHASFTKSIKRIIRGLFKKIVLLALLTQVFDYVRTIELHFYVSFLIVFLSYLIMYLDMSGYSDIAIGFGRLCGMEVPENFKKPWLSPTMTQFWRSWHATVSDWMREHIYVVLAPKRLKNVQSAFVSLITMIVLSMWHGFSILYLIGGIYNGLFLFFENLTSRTSVNKRKVSRGYFGLRCFLTNFAFALNTLLFTVSANEIIPILKGFIR